MAFLQLKELKNGERFRFVDEAEVWTVVGEYCGYGVKAEKALPSWPFVQITTVRPDEAVELVK